MARSKNVSLGPRDGRGVLAQASAVGAAALAALWLTTPVSAQQRRRLPPARASERTGAVVAMTDRISLL